MLGACVAQRGEVDTCEQVFTSTEQGRGYHDVHSVDEPSLKVLPNRCDTSTKPDVLSPGSRGGPRQGVMDSADDEVELRISSHAQHRARMVREYEDRRVIGGRLAPPATPALIGPGTTCR